MLEHAGPNLNQSVLSSAPLLYVWRDLPADHELKRDIISSMEDGSAQGPLFTDDHLNRLTLAQLENIWAGGKVRGPWPRRPAPCRLPRVTRRTAQATHQRCVQCCHCTEKKLYLVAVIVPAVRRPARAAAKIF